MAVFAMLFAIFGLAFVQNASAAQTTATVSHTFGVAYNSTVGNYLVDSQGYTLYIFGSDKPYSGSSSCNSGCTSIWFPYYNSSAITVQAQLNISDFGTINRTGGGKQFTYLGQPLYVYSHDTAPGQTNGNGFLNLWHVVTIPNYAATASSSANVTANATPANSAATNISTSKTANSVVANSTATTTASSNKTANASSYPGSTTSISAANTTAKPTVQTQGSGNSGIYAAVIVIIIIIIIIGAYLYLKRK